MLRCQFEGAIYHVMSRGVDRCDIFRSDGDRRTFLEKLQENLQTHHLVLYAYVLMSNHYHLLLMTPRANLSSFMHQFGTSYTAYFNTRHRRSGTLFGGRFRAPLVDGDAYLMKLVRYLHLNPVWTQALKSKAISEKIEYLEKYRWSSHRSYGGWDKPEAWISYAPLQALLGERTGSGRPVRAYRRYVETGLAEGDAEMEEALNRSSKAVGTEAFCQEIEKRYQQLVAEHKHSPDIAMRRIEHGCNPDRVLQAVTASLGLAQENGWERRRGNNRERDVLIWLWSMESGLLGREIGRRLGHRDGAVVSRRLRSLRSDCKPRSDFRKTCERITRALSNVKA